MIYLMQSRGWLALRFFLTPVNFAANRDLLSECLANRIFVIFSRSELLRYPALAAMP